MKPFFTKRKAMAVITSISLIALIVSGTFAWTSLNSQRVNEWRGTGTGTSRGPGGSLHDDHDNNSGKDPMKDVYIENWGDEPLIVRIKLSEYMELGKNAGSVEPNNDNVLARLANNESVPLLAGTVLAGGVISWTPHIPAASVEVCDKEFHSYWSWVMGGKKFYMPATEAQRQAAANGYVVSNTTIYNGTEAGVKETLDCTVITMEQWKAMADDDGYYWVIDKDGWAYWSRYLKPGTATGLLLNRVNRTQKPITQQYFYGINVQGEMADMASPFGASVAPAAAALDSFVTPSALTAGESDPDDFSNWITGIGVEKATPDAVDLLKSIVRSAIDDGVFGDELEVSDNMLDEIFDILSDSQ